MQQTPRYSTEASRWRAIQNRDQSASTSFVYAVISTKIYCRPACPSRLARRANVSFYDTAADAEAAGYRPCLRCKPSEPGYSIDSQKAQQDIVAKACEYIEENKGQAKFADVSKHVGLSTRYLYGLFKTVMGTTPAKYAAKFKSDQNQRPEGEVSETPSAISVATSPPEAGLTEPIVDTIGWNDLLDLDYANFAMTYDRSGSPLPCYSIWGDHSFTAGQPEKPMSSDETIDLKPFDQSGSFSSNLSQLDALTAL